MLPCCEAGGARRRSYNLGLKEIIVDCYVLMAISPGDFSGEFWGIQGDRLALPQSDKVPLNPLSWAPV